MAEKMAIEPPYLKLNIHQTFCLKLVLFRVYPKLNKESNASIHQKNFFPYYANFNQYFFSSRVTKDAKKKNLNKKIYFNKFTSKNFEYNLLSFFVVIQLIYSSTYRKASSMSSLILQESMQNIVIYFRFFINIVAMSWCLIRFRFAKDALRLMLAECGVKHECERDVFPRLFSVSKSEPIDLIDKIKNVFLSIQSRLIDLPIDSFLRAIVALFDMRQ
ncbi:hypothetical protein BpHYR1_018677 [Brachionus plicatilis]|uniref:Uncharacterized protein n=1 Tax=Brachionus plicatilis TaxID=10195 RepID=A0A3M7T5H8_BRAPC|nr:hypothetical protein BpHYR1_018677 [Brachionus plicatilis]